MSRYAVLCCAVVCCVVQVFSRHATSMSLCLMRADGSKYLEVVLDPATNRTGDVWHIQLSRLKVGGPVPAAHIYEMQRSR